MKHPIIAVTGSAGAGLSTTRHAFKAVFRRLGLKAEIVHGDAFRRYTDRQFTALLDEARASGRHISWFGPECNHFQELETLFRTYSETGGGVVREYAHNAKRAAELGVESGEFTPWRALATGSDLLFYEGQHGGLVAQTWTRRKSTAVDFPPDIDRRIGARGIDIAQYVDLLIGIVPTVNLEWIQKIQRDCAGGRCSIEESIETILRRMDDFLHYIVPQFGLTDINIQRVPLVDTSNPFIASEVPTPDESVLIVHLRDRRRHDFIDLLKRIPGSHMTRPSTIMIPGGLLGHALETICRPILAELIEEQREYDAEAAHAR
jgi:phosphoribulokinase